MRTYRKFKTIENHKCEDYLRQITNTRHRNMMLTYLRLSNHKLILFGFVCCFATIFSCHHCVKHIVYSEALAQKINV